MFSTVLLCGRRTDDRTGLSLGRYSMQQTPPLLGIGSRCRRNHSIAGGSTKSKLLSCDGGQPWLAQSCRILQPEQRGSSQALLTELCTTGDTSLLSTAGPVTTTSPTLRLTQQDQTMTTTSPLSPAVRSSLCSHQVSNRLVPSPFGAVCFWLAMAFPGDFAHESVPLFNLELEKHPRRSGGVLADY